MVALRCSIPNSPILAMGHCLACHTQSYTQAIGTLNRPEGRQTTIIPARLPPSDRIILKQSLTTRAEPSTSNIPRPGPTGPTRPADWQPSDSQQRWPQRNFQNQAATSNPCPQNSTAPDALVDLTPWMDTSPFTVQWDFSLKYAPVSPSYYIHLPESSCSCHPSLFSPR